MKAPEAIIFWQNILSMHQAAFLHALSLSHRVILVAEREMDPERVHQKWHIPDFGRAEVVVAPGEERIGELIRTPGAFHVFSGINAFKMPYAAFRLAVKLRLPVGVMSEPYDPRGWRGTVRYFMYSWLRMRFSRRIHFILPTGLTGRRCFEKVGFSPAAIFDWGYFVEHKASYPDAGNDKVRIIFVGSIDRNKQAVELARVFSRLENPELELEMIGSGPLEGVLASIAAADRRITLRGNLPNSEVMQRIADSDLLVLPSAYDGWGAVVSEALMQGTPAIASEACGSAVLLDGEVRGECYGRGDEALCDALGRWTAKGKVTEEHRARIRRWTEVNITGRAAADYFSEVVRFDLNGGERPAAPWLHDG